MNRFEDARWRPTVGTPYLGDQRRCSFDDPLERDVQGSSGANLPLRWSLQWGTYQFMKQNDDSFRTDDLELDKVLPALDDDDCRTIFTHLEEPTSASELTDLLDIPQSTLYRKLNLLTDASLVDEQVELRADEPHRKRYVRTFEEVRIKLDGENSLDLEVTHREPTPDQRLSELWSEVRKEL